MAGFVIAQERVIYGQSIATGYVIEQGQSPATGSKPPAARRCQPQEERRKGKELVRQPVNG
jgi:hypothetical protein